jgi:hypothetical protein
VRDRIDREYAQPLDVEALARGAHVGRAPQPRAYWHLPDLEAKLAEVTAAGATVKEPARDVGGGRLVASVTDPDGSVLGLLQDRRVLRRPTIPPNARSAVPSSIENARRAPTATTASGLLSGSSPQLQPAACNAAHSSPTSAS